MQSAFLVFDFKGNAFAWQPKISNIGKWTVLCPAHLPSYCLGHPCVHGLIAAVYLTCLIKEADRYDWFGEPFIAADVAGQPNQLHPLVHLRGQSKYKPSQDAVTARMYPHSMSGIPT
jgi:hypothetical protein